MGLRLLFVDDDKDILDWLKLEFANRYPEFEVITCTNGLDAINTIIAEPVDFVLTDISMEGMNGYQLFNRIKGLNEDIPIAMMTAFGYDPNHAIVNAVRDGLKDVLSKPFDVEILYDLIQQRTGHN